MLRRNGQASYALDLIRERELREAGRLAGEAAPPRSDQERRALVELMRRRAGHHRDSGSVSHGGPEHVFDTMDVVVSNHIGRPD